MAVLQSTDELEHYIGNKYSLVIVAAKRSRQLKDGHLPLAEDESPNPISKALREIQEHQVHFNAPPPEEIAPAPRDLISSLVSGLEFDLDEEQDGEDADTVDELAALLAGDEEEETERPRPIFAADPEAATGIDSEQQDDDEDDADDDEDDDSSTSAVSTDDEE